MDENLLLATGKDGTLMVTQTTTGQTWWIQLPSSAYQEYNWEESKKQKKAPRNLESFHLLKMSEFQLLLSCSDGVLYTLPANQEAFSNQASFDKAIKLVSDCGHTMPVL